MRPKVFAMEPAEQFPFEKTKKYGDLVYLFNGQRPSIFAPDFVNACVDRLTECGYDPERDYLAVAGAMVGVTRMIGGAMAEWGDAPSARCLAYNRKTENWATLSLIPEDSKDDSALSTAVLGNVSIPSGDLPISATA